MSRLKAFFFNVGMKFKKKGVIKKYTPPTRVREKGASYKNNNNKNPCYGGGGEDAQRDI